MRYLVLLCLLCLSAFADLKDPHVLAATEGDSAANLCPFVNSLTGDLVLSVVDMVVPAATPIVIQRAYVSGDGHGRWTFFPHTHLVLKDGSSQKKKYIHVAETNGSMLIYRCLDHTSHEYQLDFDKQGKGAANTAQGTISGRTNLRNTKIIRDDEKIIMYCANGTQRFYKETPIRRHYLLTHEKLPNGHYFYYEYENHKIKKVYSATHHKNRIFASITFHYQDDNHFNIITSDGRKLRYELALGHLMKATVSEKPEETLDYIVGADSGLFLKERTFPEGRKIAIDYYKKKEEGIRSHDDPRCDRVKIIYEIVEDQLIPTYRFIYDVTREMPKGKKHYVYAENGKTEIYDALNNLTRVHFDSKFYITAIERFNAAQDLHSKTTFSWDHFGQQKTKALYDHIGKKVWERSYAYDDRGNIKQETLKGDLSGLGHEESYHITYTYNERNLVTSQEEDNGKKTIFVYRPDVDLLTASYLYDETNTIIKREFRIYDEDFLLQTLVIDDGTALDIHDFTNMTERHITRYRYEPRGLLEWIEEYYFDETQERLIKKNYIGYNEKGKPKKKDTYDNECTLRYTENLDYDSYGNINYQTDPLGRPTTSSYDCFGNQLTLNPPGKLRHQYTYDKANQLKHHDQIDKEHPEVIRHTHYRYNNKLQPKSTTDFLGHETTFENDLDGNIQKTIFPSIVDEQNQSIPVITTSTYNCQGKPLTTTNARGFTTTTKYNSRGDPILITAPDGSEQKYIYNLDGTLQTTIDEEGHTTEYTHDLLGRLRTKTVAGIATETFLYSTFHLMSHTDLEGKTTTYTYNKAGQKTSETQDKDTLSFEYDSLGKLHRTLHDDVAYMTEYNFLDQLTHERTEDKEGTLLAKTSYFYDDAGNCEEIWHHQNNTIAVEKLTFDPYKRLIKKIDPLENTTTYLYNDKLHIMITQDPLDQLTITQYDPYHRPFIIQKKNSKEEETLFEELFYDPNGNLTHQKTHLPDNILHTHRHYDSQDRLSTLIEAQNSPEERTTSYTYTPRGERKTLTKPDHTIITFTYDPLGRLEEITSSTQDIHYHYTYENSLKDPTLVKDLINNTLTRRSHDTSGRILQETLGNNLTLTSTYDTQGRRTTLTLSDHSTIRYDYTPLHLHSVSKYTPEEELLYTHTYTQYDLSGALLSQELIANLGTIHYTIDLTSRTISLSSPYFTQTISDIDPCGNICSLITDNAPSIFSYDSFHQITSETADTHHHTYTCDPLSRRLEKDDIPTPVNLLNQLSANTHDKNGNPIFIDGVEYRYDSFNRLTEVIHPKNSRLVYTYDPFHRRLFKTHYLWKYGSWQKQETILFMYDGQNEIGTVEVDGSMAELRVLGLGVGAEIGAAIAVELHGKPYAPIHDLFGNLTHLIDPMTRSITSRQFFTAFGEPLSTSKPSLSPWGFSSKRIDKETRLVYFGRRFYDPLHGRFLTSDPAGLTDGLNTYAYLHHSPLSSHDLYGLMPDGPNPFGQMTNYPNCKRRIIDILSECTGFSAYVGSVFQYFFLQEPEIQKFLSGKNPVTSNYYDYYPTIPKPSIEGLKNGIIIHTNGWDTIPFVHANNLKYLSQLGGNVPVHGVHFPNFGFPTNLALAYATLNTGMNNTIMEIYHKCMDSYNKTGPEGGIMMVNHSMGCENAYFAIHLLPEHVKTTMYVLNIAPAQCLLRNSGVKFVLNIGSEGDVVHLFDKAGFKKSLEEGSFMLLPPAPGTSGLDHTLFSPTFSVPIQTNLLNFAQMFNCN